MVFMGFFLLADRRIQAADSRNLAADSEQESVAYQSRRFLLRICGPQKKEIKNDLRCSAAVSSAGFCAPKRFLTPPPSRLSSIPLHTANFYWSVEWSYRQAKFWNKGIGTSPLVIDRSNASSKKGMSMERGVGRKKIATPLPSLRTVGV